MGHREFSGSETALNDIIIVEHVIITHRLYNTKSECQCKLRTLADKDVSMNKTH